MNSKEMHVLFGAILPSEAEFRWFANSGWCRCIFNNTVFGIDPLNDGMLVMQSLHNDAKDDVTAIFSLADPACADSIKAFMVSEVAKAARRL